MSQGGNRQQKEGVQSTTHSRVSRANERRVCVSASQCVTHALISEHDPYVLMVSSRVLVVSFPCVCASLPHPIEETQAEDCN